MKKKIRLLMCVLIATLGLAGCSGSREKADYDTTAMESTAEFIVQQFSQMGEEGLAQFQELSEFQLDYMLLQTGLKLDGKVFLAVINSWNAGEEECGAFVSHGDYKVDVKAKEVVLSAEAEYKDRDATIAFTFDKSANLKSMDISAKFSTGEIMTKAGLNTLLGMGTVFAVLVFLAFVISLMKYIPALLDGTSGKQSKAAPAAVAEKIEEQPAVVADETDDLELIAVITAAIAAQEGTSTDGFVVRSIRRRPSNNWI